jgi:hypothetical protein
MLTGVMHRTGVAPALLSDPAPRQPSPPRSERSIASPLSTLSASPMRFRPTGLLLCGVVVASSACSIDATAPSRLAPSPGATHVAAELSDGGSNAENGAWRATASNGETSTYVVTIDPQHPQVLRFGDYTLELPGNAICDGASGYGLDMFDLECKTEKNPVTIVALVQRTADGIPRIDLMPEMRFNPKRVVTLSLFVGDAPMPASPRMLYCATFAMTECIDEAQLDATLATQVDAASSTIFRRIKHFSGYFVQS